ncbi:MAG TPA: hypothetical protein VMZ26_10520 [Pyrinomonadaceae bacterium]|nr:hypothetical protein [Pyrinomonadaceae bacterium]
MGRFGPRSNDKGIAPRQRQHEYQPPLTRRRSIAGVPWAEATHG